MIFWHLAQSLVLPEKIDTQLLIDKKSNNPLITVAKGCPLMDFTCHF